MDDIKIPKVENVQLVDRFGSRGNAMGTLHLTLTHTFFVETSGSREIWILVKQISAVERPPLTTVGSPLLIRCKNFLTVKFLIPRDRDCQDVYLSLLKLSATETVDQLLCFYYKPPLEMPRSQGWHFFDLEAEYLRMGVPNQLWVASNINWDYEVCDTYPPVLYVPSAASMPVLLGSSRFRSRGRLPVLTYLHRDGKSALCRCSQPLAGFSARCLEDEQLLQTILRSNAGTTTLYVVDTRPRINAMTNRAQGKGYENENVYKDIHFRFFDIDNIHVMRNSLEKLLRVCEDPSLNTSSYVSGIDKAGWLRHIRTIIEASVFVAQTLLDGNSVLVHCSDGWDRTAQVCSLAQVILDPHYRTIQGIQGLIEKEWLAFGHKFTERCGLLSSGDAQEVSPVFTQFLESVWQLSRQHPNCFQFNERFLLTLHDEAQSSRFGTFVGNCHKDRVDLKLSSRSYSVWGYIAEHIDDFSNPLYLKDSAQVLPVSLSPQLITIWHGLYNRWDSELHARDNVPDLLTSLRAGTTSLTEHTQLVERRVAQLCHLLGKSEEVTQRKLQGLATSESLFTLKDLDPNQLGDKSDEVSNVRLPADSLSSSESGLGDCTGGATGDSGPDSLQNTPTGGPCPSVDQLVAEVSSVCVDWGSTREAKDCASCGVAFNYFTRKLHCYRCGRVTCRKCIPGLVALPGHPDNRPSPVCKSCREELTRLGYRPQLDTDQETKRSSLGDSGVDGIGAS